MTKNQQDFLDLFFNKGEGVCVSHNKLGWHAVSLEDLKKEKILLTSPNEKIDDIQITSDMINMISVNPVTPGERRMDTKVTSFRGFLIEMDDGKLSEQMKYIKESGLPFSACVFSGSKSLHFGIVLDKSLPSLSVYRMVSRWIVRILDKADNQTINPTRSIRFPDNKRRVYARAPEGGSKKIPMVVPFDERKPQKLVELKERVTQAELFTWLSKHKDKKPKIRKKKLLTNTPASFKKLSTWAKEELAEGVTCEKIGSRNKTWYALACELALANFSLDDTYSILEGYFTEEHDFTQSEWEYTVRRGYEKAFEQDGY